MFIYFKYASPIFLINFLNVLQFEQVRIMVYSSYGEFENPDIGTLPKIAFFSFTGKTISTPAATRLPTGPVNFKKGALCLETSLTASKTSIVGPVRAENSVPIARTFSTTKNRYKIKKYIIELFIPIFSFLTNSPTPKRHFLTKIKWNGITNYYC